MATFPSNNYDPRLIVVDQSNGCTLTRASIRGFTKQDFEDQASKEVGMDRIIASTKEARMAGVRENSLWDLFLSKHVALKEGKGSQNPSVIMPFSLVPRQNQVNANFFRVGAGAAHPTAGSGGIPVHAWQLTLKTGSNDGDGSPWVKSPSQSLKNLEKYFLPGNYLTVEWSNGSSASIATNFEILSAVNADSGGVSQALVTVIPNKTESWWASATTDEKNVYKPTAGLAIRLANSTSDYESRGSQVPAVNNRSLIEYWQQTHRWSFTYNDEYVKALEAPLTSDFYKKFATLPLAEQRRQAELDNQQMLMQTFFYGDRINENQTTETFRNLPQVNDPADPSCPIEFKATTLGIRTQLAEGLRVKDVAGAAFNLDNWLEDNYNLKRYRDADGRSTITVIDWFTDRFTKGRIRDLLFKYYKARFSMDLTGFVQLGKKIEFNGSVLFEYDLYDLPDQGVQAAIFTHPYFDDKISAAVTAQRSRQRALWAIDWSDIAINIIRTASANRVTNEADELYRYVIKVNNATTKLNSKTFEVRVGDVNRSLLYENFSDACPTLTVPGCELA